ncbi:hypothetical protein CEUSTIGMA_g5923.t1 [Chlamydomonas eustigma]|uniref:Small ribosomal subunit protein uS10 domain-containing protein n=1 Tax=Chlamydomonas eustigma TaxID=1157962 RepID=A0A250X5X0_9CHLO|nr:hypothetical protein CEUSTIGMA_g5923.t1 [Chlamydomonas eustigma]|eukprot:GAX78484.1 hypothetical protein CEUSTIGMA_g5923.t1 [Chlamydomonas eustigma]
MSRLLKAARSLALYSSEIADGIFSGVNTSAGRNYCTVGRHITTPDPCFSGSSVTWPASDYNSTSAPCNGIFPDHMRQFSRSIRGTSTRRTGIDSQQAGHSVHVEVTAFEKRYLQAATNVIHDLFLINFAPKSASALSTTSSATSPKSPCALPVAASLKSVRVNWKRSRFTLIRGPFVDKTGMEQFETRKYKAEIKGSTNSAEEVEWLMEHLKLYEFTGVQIEITLSSSTFLMPPSTSSIHKGGSASDSILSQHRTHIAQYLQPAAAVVAAKQQCSISADAELRKALQNLRATLQGGLEVRRRGLQAVDWYQRWHQQHKVEASMRSTDKAPSPQPALPEILGDDEAGADGPVGGLQDEGRRHAAAFLAAIDAALLSIRLDVLERHNHFPYLFASYVPGTSKLTAAQWMQAVLKYGQYKQRMTQISEEAQLIKAYSSYTIFSHTLLYTLFKVWVQQTVSQFKPYLALPTKAETELFMQSMAAEAANKQQAPLQQSRSSSSKLFQ